MIVPGSHGHSSRSPHNCSGVHGYRTITGVSSANTTARPSSEVLGFMVVDLLARSEPRVAAIRNVNGDPLTFWSSLSYTGRSCGRHLDARSPARSGPWQQAARSD